MRERPDISWKTPEWKVLYPGIKDPLYACVFLQIIIKSLRYCDIDYSQKYTRKNTPNKKKRPSWLLIATFLTYKLLNHRPSLDQSSPLNISYDDLNKLLSIYVTDRQLDQNTIEKIPNYILAILQINKDGKPHNTSNIMQLTLLNDNLYKSNSKNVVRYNQSFFWIMDYSWRQAIRKKIDRLLQRRYNTKKWKPYISGQNIVYSVFKKVITSLIPRWFFEQEVLLYFLSMVDAICLYTKHEETNYLNKRRHISTKYEALFSGEMLEDDRVQAMSALGEETSDMTTKLLHTYKDSIKKYLFSA